MPKKEKKIRVLQQQKLAYFENNIKEIKEVNTHTKFSYNTRAKCLIILQQKITVSAPLRMREQSRTKFGEITLKDNVYKVLRN